MLLLLRRRRVRVVRPTLLLLRGLTVRLVARRDVVVALALGTVGTPLAAVRRARRRQTRLLLVAVRMVDDRVITTVLTLARLRRLLLGSTAAVGVLVLGGLGRLLDARHGHGRRAPAGVPVRVGAAVGADLGARCLEVQLRNLAPIR